MSARGKRVCQDYSGSIVIGVLKLPLLQQCETQTEARILIVPVLREQFAKLLFGTFVIAIPERFVGTLARLAIAGRERRNGHRQANKNAGQESNCRWGEPPLRVKSLHDL